MHVKTTTQKPYNLYRKTLAWTGFVAIYLVLPLLLAGILTHTIN